MTNEELAWAAGLFEGEGSVIRRTNPQRNAPFSSKNYVYLALRIASSDKDVIMRFRDLCGGAVYYRRFHGGLGKKPQWYCQINGDTAMQILLGFLRHLGERRSARAWEIINEVVSQCGPR